MQEVPMRSREKIIIPDQEKLRQEIAKSLQKMLGINKDTILTLAKKEQDFKKNEEQLLEDATANDVIANSFDSTLPILEVTFEESQKTNFLSIVYGNQTGEVEEKFITIIKDKEANKIKLKVELTRKSLAQMFGL